MMRALEREVTDAVWSTIEPMLPPRPAKRRGRPRKPDRDVFLAIMWRLVLGCSWETVEHLLDRRISDTTIRERRDEWIAAGVFDRLINQAILAFDRIIGLDLSEVAVDGSQHKAPFGGEGTGPSPVDRGKCGWKWSIATDRQGIPIGWEAAGANQVDSKLLDATLDGVDARGLLAEIETLHLDRGYDNANVRAICAEFGLGDVVTAKKRKPVSSKKKAARQPVPMGMRWPVERTNSWLSNFGQLRRNTDRFIHHRIDTLNLAIAVASIAGNERPRNVLALRSWKLRLNANVPGPVVVHPVRMRDSSATSVCE